MGRPRINKRSRRVEAEAKSRERTRGVLVVVLIILIMINASLRASSPDTNLLETTTPSHESNKVTTPATEAVTAAARATPKPAPKPVPATPASEPAETPICRVAVENKMDYNYQYIESAVLRFPLDWEKLGCSIPADANQKPLVVFDLALAEHHSAGRGEKERFIKHWDSKLRGQIKERTDGRVRAQFGVLVRYTNYVHPYKAIIGVSCDSYPFQQWLSHSTTHCIFHNPCTTCTPDMLKRSCFVDPSHVSCSFVQLPLPQATW